MTVSTLSAINRKTIRNAGPRYTPGIDAEAPNIQIVSLMNALDGLAVNDEFRRQVEDQKSEIIERWGRSEKSLFDKLPIERIIAKLKELLEELRTTQPGSSSKVMENINKILNKAEQHFKKEHDALDEKAIKRREELELTHKVDEKDFYRILKDDKILSSIQEARNRISYLEIAFRDCRSFCNSSSCILRFKAVAVLTGAWGTGKTHLLCDVALHFTNSGKPALVILAKDVEPGKHCGDSIALSTSLASSFEELVQLLDNLGRSVGQRALLLIDGINESDVKAWRRDVANIIHTVKQYDYVGIILSCRDPFQKVIFSSRLFARIPKLEHLGFDDVEFEAQKAFFKYYKIPLPEIPLLAEEFSRPLTLKILCQAFEKLPRKEKKKGFYGLSSGQKGMTFVLEHFVFERTKEIEKSLQLPPKFCWMVLKGDHRIKDPELSGFATYMAYHSQEFIPFKAALRILKARKEINTLAQAKYLMRLLVREGIIYHHFMWRPESEGGDLQVVGLPYQRFTDHIIARHLLDKYLDTTSRKSIIDSFSPTSHLGQLFQIQGNEYFQQYENENWAEAIIVEFPEFVKKVLPSEERELFFHLPKEHQNRDAYFQPFVDGLVWRAPTSFSQQTDIIVGWYFWSSHAQSRQEIAEALISVATKLKHPYSGIRLYRNLACISMQQRDVTWSEFLRKRHYPGTAVERFVTFYEHFSAISISYEAALNAIAVLATFLPTTARKLRDRATKALVLIGEKQPKALLDFVRESIKFNDLYVRERLMAAAYGVAMSQYAVTGDSFKSDLVSFTNWLVSEFILPTGSAQTQHTLLRGYTLGIIELAKHIDHHALRKAWNTFLQPPFKGIPNPFPNPEKISPWTLKNTKDVLYGDFENSTIGSLINDRRNYDMEHPIFKRVRKQIEWRMVNLGYDKKVFESIDIEIGQDSYWREQHGDKIDRYATKYGWIAYFEMYGLRQAYHLIDDSHERSSNCDIDPSFPRREAIDVPVFDRVFDGRVSSKKHSEWLRHGPNPNYDNILLVDKIQDQMGPWLLVEGSVRETSSRNERQIWTSIETIIVKAKDVSRFEDKILRTGHPSSVLRSTRGDYYTYFGEVGWSRHFGISARKQNGKLLKPEQTLFSQSKRVPSKEKLKKAWYHLDFKYLFQYMKARGKRKKRREYDRLAIHLEDVNSKVLSADQLSIYEVVDQCPSPVEFIDGYKKSFTWKWFGGIEVETLSWNFAWESYHSEINDFSGFTLPSPWICDMMGLHSRNRSINLYDSSGRPASFYIANNKSWDNAIGLLYIRRDILEKYLKRSDRTIVWVIWGERNLDYESSMVNRDDRDIIAALQENSHVHRRVVRLPT